MGGAEAPARRGRGEAPGGEPVPGAPEGRGISPRFLALLAEAALHGKRVLDLGCGRGRLTLLLGGRAARVLGLDRDPALIQEARRRAEAAGLGNVEFHVADVEREEYGRWAPDLITAHLCASDAIIQRAGRALAAGGSLAMVTFHTDQWKETGAVSRFAYDEARMEEALGAAGFAVEALEVERVVERFGSAEEARAAADALEGPWRTDGRRVRYLAFVEAGGRTLTRAHLLVTARRR